MALVSYTLKVITSIIAVESSQRLSGLIQDMNKNSTFNPKKKLTNLTALTISLYLFLSIFSAVILRLTVSNAHNEPRHRTALEVDKLN
jgi:hypothetical protein